MNERQKEIIVIPATKDKRDCSESSKLKRVASYSRVSTDFEEQLTSFHAQKTFYTDLILRTNGWKMAGTYADEGISGVSASNRPDFMRMIKDCRKGKIDLIITKSISRFARNTVDNLKYIRELKSKGIGVYFEKENINTLEENSEFVITMLASIAQEESHSLSMNVKMGIRMGMQEGKVAWQYKNMYGFKKGEDGKPQIIEEDALVIKRIFAYYVSGKSEKVIADILNADSVKSKAKSGKWNVSTIQNLLQNERMCGDVILQKTYVENHLSKKVKINNGELPKIFIKNNHPAIVSRDMFDKAQNERAKRNNKPKVTKSAKSEQGKYSSKYALSGILICGECGTPYKRVVWTRKLSDGSKLKQYVWRCYKRLDYGRRYCKDSITVDEKSLHEAIMTAISVTKEERNNVIPIMLNEYKNIMWEDVGGGLNVEQAEKEIQELKEKAMDMVTQSIKDNTIIENELIIKALSDEAKRLSEIVDEFKENNHNKLEIDSYINELADISAQKNMDHTIYDDDLIRQIIHTIKVSGETAITIYFRNGFVHEQDISLNIKKLGTKRF